LKTYILVALYLKSINNFISFYRLNFAYFGNTYLLTELKLSWADANCAATLKLPTHFTWGRKQMKFPKRRVSTPNYTGRWKNTKKKKPVILCGQKNAYHSSQFSLTDNDINIASANIFRRKPERFIITYFALFFKRLSLVFRKPTRVSQLHLKSLYSWIYQGSWRMTLLQKLHIYIRFTNSEVQIAGNRTSCIFTQYVIIYFLKILNIN
jgi:hypothetical protein